MSTHASFDVNDRRSEEKETPECGPMSMNKDFRWREIRNQARQERRGGDDAEYG